MTKKDSLQSSEQYKKEEGAVVAPILLPPFKIVNQNQCSDGVDEEQMCRQLINQRGRFALSFFEDCGYMPPSQEKAARRQRGLDGPDLFSARLIPQKQGLREL